MRAYCAGALNNLFQLATTTGILLAQVVNYSVHNAGPWAWRISLAVAGGTTVMTDMSHRSFLQCTCRTFLLKQPVVLHLLFAAQLFRETLLLLSTS